MLRTEKPPTGEQLEKDLVHVICYRKTDEIDRLLSINVNPDTPSTKPALHMAVEINDLPTVKKLLDRGANVEIGWNKYWNNAPLKEAAQLGNDDIVKELLRRKADVNRCNNFGVSALHEAAYWKRVSTVKILLENGAAVDPENNDGRTPLYYVVRHIEYDNSHSHFADPAHPTIEEVEIYRGRSEFRGLCLPDKLSTEEVRNILERSYVNKLSIAKNLVEYGGNLENLYSIDLKSRTAGILREYAQSLKANKESKQTFPYTQALMTVGSIHAHTPSSDKPENERKINSIRSLFM